jgi:hypothetical protein
LARRNFEKFIDIKAAQKLYSADGAQKSIVDDILLAIVMSIQTINLRYVNDDDATGGERRVKHLQSAIAIERFCRVLRIHYYSVHTKNACVVRQPVQNYGWIEIAVNYWKNNRSARVGETLQRG